MGTVEASTAMKLLVVVVQDEDVDALLDGLRAGGFGATKIGSSGGLLRTGNSTILIGVAARQVPAVRTIINRHCHRRTQLAVPYGPVFEPGLLAIPEQFEVEVGGAIIFIHPVVRFEQF